MIKLKLVASAAALSLMAAPAVAQFDRSTAPVAGESELGGDGDGSTLLWSAIAIAAFVGAVYLITDDDDDDEPISA